MPSESQAEVLVAHIVIGREVERMPNPKTGKKNDYYFVDQ